MSLTSKEFVDEYQNVHFKRKVLGKGGQGVVFRTSDPDVAIKLVIDSEGNAITEEASLDFYKQRLKRLSLLPLPNRINLSVPIALLKNQAGYVMQLLNEMVPFSVFFSDAKSTSGISSSDIPAWLSGLDLNEAKILVHYQKTGGLRRRLLALYKCASVLARIHGLSLVYGDVSPNNAFISEELLFSSIWLIDADNLRFDVETGGGSVYTPKYGAPEVVQGKDCSRPSTDCHAFAILSFYMLSLIHPFIGKKVDGTGDTDWADSVNGCEDSEEMAYSGRLPWVDDQSDDSNSSESGLPRSLILTNQLKELYEMTFSIGRTNPHKRPVIYHWPEALARAADLTIHCPSCGMDYYHDYLDQETNQCCCPYCNTHRPPHFVFDAYQWRGANVQLGPLQWRFVREIESNVVTIPKRLIDEFVMEDSDSEVLRISVSDRSILITRSELCANDDIYVAADNDAQCRFKRVISKLQLQRDHRDISFWIHSDGYIPRLIHCSIVGGCE